jgi:transforming growth factor-beta-induced protein
MKKREKHMRKFVILLTILSILNVVLPTFADHHAELPTLAELVVSSAGADEAEFTILLAAVQAADPAVIEALGADDYSDEAQLTVFAPTDAAFEALLEDMEITAEDLLASEELTNILMYHVVAGRVMAEDVVALLEDEENEGEFEVETLNGKYATVSTEMDNIYINDAQIVATDVEGKNGVVHVIDSVLMPLPTIAETVIAAAEGDMPEFSILLAAVLAADEAVVETLSDPAQDLTVFAPTDAAFEAALEALGLTAEELLGSEGLTGILLYHVLSGEVMAEDVVALLEENDGMIEVEMLDGNMAAIEAVEDGITIAGANIIVTDIVTANGVIHVIDAVILPATE